MHDGRSRPATRRLFTLLSLAASLALLRCDAHESSPLALPGEAAAFRVLVIGDSLTDFSDGFALQSRLGSGWIAAHRGVINRDYLTWTGRLDEAFDEMPVGPPDAVIVALGTNDSFLYGPEQFLSHWASFHADLRTRSLATTFYCLMPPSLIESLGPSVLRNNAALRSATLPAGVRLLDLEAVIAAAGPWPPTYAADDPLHPTALGYDLIGQAMAQTLRAGF